MRICHNLPFLYVLICFASNVNNTKTRYYSYNIVQLDKGRFVLLSEGSEVQVLFGVPSPEIFLAKVSGILYYKKYTMPTATKRQPDPQDSAAFYIQFLNGIYTRFL